MNVTTDLDARFRAAAVAEGLVDVRYDVVASPVGDLHVAATGRGLCRISYQEDDWEEQLARGFGIRVLRSPLDDVRRELDEYFEGRRRSFDLPLDLRVAEFPAAVLHELALVPYGQTDTYGKLAARAGRPRAAVVLRYGYDLPYAQIADALGSSEEAARAAASSGVRRLRRTHERDH